MSTSTPSYTSDARPYSSSGPLVEIVMATYNGEKYLKEQIESIRRQSYKNWRLVIHDDGSTDSTLELIASLAKDDDRIHICSDDRVYGSSCKNFMSLLKSSTADYVMCCDQDDVWFEDKVAVEMKEMERNEAISGNVPMLVASDLIVVNSMLEEISSSFWEYQQLNPKCIAFKSLIAQSLITGCTMLVNRPLVEKATSNIDFGAIENDVIMHDWWFSIIAAAFGKICLINRPTVYYRQHGDNAVGAQKFSPLNAINKYSLLRERVLKTIRQAEAFHRCFEPDLPQDLSKELKQYAELDQCKSRVTRVKTLLLCGFWKHGLGRKLGQLYAILSL